MVLSIISQVCAVCLSGGYLYRCIKENATEAKILANKGMSVDKTEVYSQFFTNLGLINEKRGDWIKFVGADVRKNYELIKFKLSDTLSSKDFLKAKEHIEEKMLTSYAGENYRNKIQIFNEKGYMYFRVLNENIDLIPYEFVKTQKHLIPLGTDLDDNVVYWDLKKDPHLKVIGSTGSGKSRQQNIILNHIYHNITGAKLWLMDFKDGIEFGAYAGTKNVVAYADDLKDVPLVLSSFKDEYEKRIKIIKDAGYRDFNAYVENNPQSKLKRGFLVIDEFADLMQLNDTKTGYNVINELIEIARKVRASGLSIVLGTQRPTADSIPSSMKNNITGTIAMKMENELNSRLVIDDTGCELLEQSNAIGVLGSKKVCFRSYYIPDEVMEATIRKFQKVDDDKQNSKVIEPSVFK